MKKILLFMIFMVSIGLNAQNDTIRLKNGNVLYGEIKNLKSGILTMETPYSDDDFTIDFSEVTELKIEKICFVILTGGRRLTGYLRTETPNEITFKDMDGNTQNFPIEELVVLEELDENFWKRISGFIDVSYTLTKANNATQFTVGGGLSYRGPKWVGTTVINSLTANQDNVEEVSRTDFNAEIQRVLPANWYLLGNLSFLSNTEQSLDGRYSIRVGGGRYLALTNKLAWGLSAGVNYNIENFSDITPSRESTELYFGTNIDMFDYADWSLKSNLNAFPSLTESGRWRVDYNLSLKWDLPYDFYFKTNFQFNYDNEAAATGSEFDYVFTTGVGWSFN